MKDKKLPILIFIEAIKRREIEISYNTIDGICVEGAEKYIEYEFSELIECHSEGIRYMAQDTIVPQPVSIEYIKKKYNGK